MKTEGNTSYSMIDALWGSFFSPDFYLSVLRTWKGLALRYLLLLSLVFSVLVISGEYLKVSRTLQSPAVQTMFQQIPTLTLKNGELSTSDQSVVKIAKENNVPVIVIDPKNTIPDLNAAGAPVLLHSNKLIMQLASEHKPIELPYKQFFHDGNLTGEDVMQQLKQLLNAAILPVGVPVVIFNFIFLLARALLLAAIIRAFRSQFEFIPAVRLMIAASTPSTILSGLAFLAGVNLGAWDSPVFTGIFFAYIVFAISVASKLPQD